jgi:multimeric flavodoxin WrbA
MLRRLLDKLKNAGADTELILLREMDIEGCDGCLTCEAGGEQRKGICRIQDDMQGLYPKLLEADVLILGTPVYFEMLSGQLKTFMDRTCPIWTGMGGKLVAGVAVAEGGIGQAVRNLKTYAGLCGMRWAGSVTALAKTPKQASKDRGAGKRIDRLAGRLVKACDAG